MILITGMLLESYLYEPEETSVNDEVKIITVKNVITEEKVGK